MNIKKTSVLMAAALAVATVLAAGLTVLPNSVQDAQANPCSGIDQDSDMDANGDAGGDIGDIDQGEVDIDVDCEIYGPVDIEEVP